MYLYVIHCNCFALALENHGELSMTSVVETGNSGVGLEGQRGEGEAAVAMNMCSENKGKKKIPAEGEGEDNVTEV